ncbi:4'-phosphopantetheinyl transferase family protein [Fusibacillus kribbianus]|uniref:4'-phosphopantetheinyl transferase superfamily protein n=1 Tax=Fusibacillus kribbianus TaxID=3044208 RepID=A0AAP4F077_9FIRM|nr:4'-phosphopantetheinyl transferase superfamily protein [Ruminococcus sp. YH-rum2234]MDI9241453.1 4'-phosphopantetheinyl transferase superfamily protein [Ruminococcus sp. YH-rum2234]
MSRPSVGIFLFPADDSRRPEERLRAAAEASGLVRENSPEYIWHMARGIYGKPYFPAQPDLHFSISHSGDWWLCALSETPIGVDLQEHTKNRGEEEETAAARYGRMAERFFHPSEALWVCKNRYERFFMVWAAKESYVKYTGEGIGDSFGQFSVIPERPFSLSADGERYWTAAGVCFCEREFPQGYTTCICTGMPAEYALFTCTGPAFRRQSIF